MTSVLSTINPLFEKNQTLTRSIYTTFNRSRRDGTTQDSANALTNTSETETLYFDGSNNLVLDTGNGNGVVSISPEGSITTQGNLNVSGVINGSVQSALYATSAGHANSADSATTAGSADTASSLTTAGETALQTKFDDRYLSQDTTDLNIETLNIQDTANDDVFSLEKVESGTSEKKTSFLELKQNSARLIWGNKEGFNVVANIGLGYKCSIRFNTARNGNISNPNYPRGELNNLVMSTITENQLQKLDKDKVCPTYQYCKNTYPTYQYCENTYAKPSDLTSLIVQDTGTSTTNIMSQKAVTDAINNAGSDVTIVQETGNSTTSVMSQNAVTQAINSYTPDLSDFCKTINLTDNSYSDVSINVSGGILISFLSTRPIAILSSVDRIQSILLGYIKVAITLPASSSSITFCSTYDLYLGLGTADIVLYPENFALTKGFFVKSTSSNNQDTIIVYFPVNFINTSEYNNFYLGIKAKDFQNKQLTLANISVLAASVQRIKY